MPELSLHMVADRSSSSIGVLVKVALGSVCRVVKVIVFCIFPHAARSAA